MRTYSCWNSFRTICLYALAGTLISAVPTWAAPTFQDPLDVPAQMRTAINTRPLMAITHAGSSLVAVGSRGMIIRSEDDGKSWTQSAVPVQSDLLAVHFPTPEDGWAVGHEGVILHSGDGGKNWTKQLDGRIAADAFRTYYASAPRDVVMREAAAQIELNYKAGPVLPWLDVWFEDDRKGFVVGSFGMIAATTDGGETWEPWLHHVDNAMWLNMNSIRGVGGNIYIVGERGMVWKLERKNRWFLGTATGYGGSFFGIAGTIHTLVVFGLRGNVYHSVDGGMAWEEVKVPAAATITAGTVIPDSDGLVLVNSACQILQGDAQGRSFRLVGPLGEGIMRCTGIVINNQRTVVVSGLNGVRTETLSGAAK